MKSALSGTLLILNLVSAAVCLPAELPHRILVGVSVIDTPIVRDAISYAQGYEENSVFNHSLRARVFGSMIINRDPAYINSVDKEVHALGSIIHDIGFDPKEKHGAEVDPQHAALGGNAVRMFLANNKEGKLWKEPRVQNLVDAVTLHLENSDTTKALEIRAVRDGQQIDLNGPSGYVTAAEHQAVVAAYPLGNMKDHLAHSGQADGHSGLDMMSATSIEHGHSILS